VPLVYPFLVYLLARMLLLAFGRGVPRAPLQVNFPIRWLLFAVVFLVGLRVGLNVLNSNVIDVGYAGVIGAHKLVHGQSLYGGWPTDNASGDTYGPVAYYAYVPFLAIFGWSGKWDQLPASHGAAIAFDLLTLDPRNGHLYVSHSSVSTLEVVDVREARRVGALLAAVRPEVVPEALLAARSGPVEPVEADLQIGEAVQLRLVLGGLFLQLLIAVEGV